MCHKTDLGRAPHGSAEALPLETEVLTQLRSVSENTFALCE